MLRISNKKRDRNLNPISFLNLRYKSFLKFIVESEGKVFAAETKTVSVCSVHIVISISQEATFG